ncbi:hypothetical protein R3P38DRAFT_2844465 [Favolaschia claudopus]|uniref:F-box domain-containing protein n=1 Tax=Favolaschia claudopus TaxID=2862362 RepID=A0AAW0E5F7_9AGAR
MTITKPELVSAIPTSSPAIHQAPSLPLELEREIFETAAVANTRIIPTFLRVCRRVHAWIEPLLYRTLILTGDDSPYLIALRAKPIEFQRKSVRHVYIQCSFFPSNFIRDLLSDLSDIQSLLMDGHYDVVELRPVLDKVRPRKLSLWVQPHSPEWSPITPIRPLFLCVTHLELFKPSFVPSTWEEWSPLASLPALTHICLIQGLIVDLLQPVVRNCHQLQAVIAAYFEERSLHLAETLANNLPVADSRVVVMLQRDYVADWTVGARGGRDLWVRADDFLAQKRCGKIPVSTYFLG